jgi:hypothetical protein
MPTSKRCNKRKHKLHNKTRNKATNFRIRHGGSSTTKVIPFKNYGYTCGTSPRTEAICKLANESRTQNKNNHTGGGAKSQARVIVPSFPDSGNKISPYNANTNSKICNQVWSQAIANGKDDKFAYINTKKSTQIGGVRSNIKRYKTQTRRKYVKKQSKYTKNRRHKGGNIEKK